MRLEHAGKKKSYLMAAAGILVGYLFFFTSSLWYPGQNNASEYTPIGQLQKIGETENSVTIEYWAYASEQQAMSVELDVNTAEKVSFEAVDKKRREIPVTVKLSQAGTYVLELDSVQPDFQAVSLRVTVEGKIIRLYTNIYGEMMQGDLLPGRPAELPDSVPIPDWPEETYKELILKKLTALYEEEKAERQYAYEAVFTDVQIHPNGYTYYYLTEYESHAIEVSFDCSYTCDGASYTEPCRMLILYDA